MRTLAFRSPLVSRLSVWDIFANCQVASVRNLYHVPYHIISYHLISSHIISYHLISSHIISYHLISSHIPSGCHADFQTVSFLRQAKRPQEVLTLRFCNIPRGDQRATDDSAIFQTVLWTSQFSPRFLHCCEYPKKVLTLKTAGIFDLQLCPVTAESVEFKGKTRAPRP